MSFMDKMKKKADELGLDQKAKQLQEAATTAAHQAREKAGELATENRDKIDSAMDKAGTAIDQRTEGKYSDKIAKAKEQIGKGVDKVSEGEPGAHGTAAGTASATATAKASGVTDPLADPLAGPLADPVTDPLADPVTQADSPLRSGVTPSSVNPPEVSEPQSGHPAPGYVPGVAPLPSKSPDQPTT